MPDKNKTNLAKNTAISVFFVEFSLEVRIVRLRSPSPKTIENIGVLVDSREEPPINPIFRRASRLIHCSFRGLYLYINPRKRLDLIARHA